MKLLPTLSVFTPTYNRAHTLTRTYDSLCRQTNMDFKWIIIDDGSADNTRDLVSGWLENEDAFQIEYYWKENGGMHTAHNTAYEHINTELAVCIDSGDWMPDNAVELIIQRWKKYGSKNYCGIIALDVYADSGNIVGTKFPDNLFCCKVFDLKRKYGVICDKKYVLRTEIIREYLPYPVFKGERNMSVNYPYSQMCTKYDFLCCNDVYCIVDYQQGGLTKGIFSQYIKSPNSFLFTRNVYLGHLPYWQDRFRTAIHYVSSAIFAKHRNFIRESNDKIAVILAIPLGVLLNIYIRFKTIGK